MMRKSSGGRLGLSATLDQTLLILSLSPRSSRPCSDPDSPFPFLAVGGRLCRLQFLLLGLRLSGWGLWPLLLLPGRPPLPLSPRCLRPAQLLL